MGRELGHDAAVALGAAEHDLDAITPPVAALVVFQGLPVKLPAWGSWRATAGSGLLTDSRSNATRSVGTDQNLKKRHILPKDGMHLIPLQ